MLIVKNMIMHVTSSPVVVSKTKHECRPHPILVPRRLQIFALPLWRDGARDWWPHVPWSGVNDYYDVFAASVPNENFENPQASIDTYVAAFKDTLESFHDNGVNDELPLLLSRLVNMGADAGLGDKQVTSLVNLLSK